MREPGGRAGGDAGEADGAHEADGGLHAAAPQVPGEWAVEASRLGETQCQKYTVSRPTADGSVSRAEAWYS